MLLSYIVPVYNVENYLLRCIESLYNQGTDLDIFEVIIVNDGSTDASGIIAENLVKTHKYPNLKVIHQENLGLSGARNTGIEFAKGDYIWCIDSDDFLKVNTVHEVINDINEYHPDILFVELLEILGKIEKRVCVQKLGKYQEYSGVEAILNGFFPSSACSAIIRKNFICKNNLSFFPKLYHQDVEFMYRAVTLAQSVVFTDNVPYVYEVHPNTISRSNEFKKKIKRLVDNGIIANSFLKFAQNISNKKLKEKIELQAYSIARGTVYSIWKDERYNEKKIANEVLKKFRKLGLFPLIYNEGSLKKKFITCFLNLKFYKLGK